MPYLETAPRRVPGCYRPSEALDARWWQTWARGSEYASLAMGKFARVLLNIEASMFYPNAMNKARVRVASVRIKNSATDAQAHSIGYNAGLYASEMNTFNEVVRDDGALVFVYDSQMEEKTTRELLVLAERLGVGDDFAPIITDRVH